MQEQSIGKDRLEVVKLLQEHGVVVRGGPQEGQKFIEALLVEPLVSLSTFNPQAHRQAHINPPSHYPLLMRAKACCHSHCVYLCLAPENSESSPQSPEGLTARFDTLL